MPEVDPADAPAVVDSLFHVKEGDTVLFRGANDWTRLVDAKRGTYGPSYALCKGVSPP